MEKLYLGNLPYVFMTYSFKDKEMALELKDALMLSGCNIWLDNGSASEEENEQRILDSNCLLLLVTRNSIVSRHVERDLTLARKKKKQVYVVYLDDFGFPLNLSNSHCLGECVKGDFKRSIFRLRDKIVKGLPIEVFNHIEEPFYISELNRFFTEVEYYSLQESKYKGQGQMNIGACIVNDKGERISLWKYVPMSEYSLNARLSCTHIIDDPYFSHKCSKSIVANFVLFLRDRDNSRMLDCDIVVTAVISRLDESKPKISLVNCEIIGQEGNEVIKDLIKHIEKSFN